MIHDYLLATSQLGFMPSSPKTVTLMARDRDHNCIDAPLRDIPFVVRRPDQRRPRPAYGPMAERWDGSRFGWPYFIDRGPFDASNAPAEMRGILHRIQSPWGVFWQADFSTFDREGVWQVETEYATTCPFRIAHDLYDRLAWGYMTFIKCRRSGYEQPGIMQAEHLDDAVLESTGEYVCATGGWYDAGDVRKWLSQTQFILSGLVALHEHGPAGYHQAIQDEIAWGNRYFHAMINADGRVYEDVGGGNVPPAFDFETQWWFENHPGCIADGAGNRMTDNVHRSGDERTIRVSYNPWTQFGFVRSQAQAGRVLPQADARRCLFLAERAWRYAQGHPHDGRTLFVAGELLAATHLSRCRSDTVDPHRIENLARTLLARQERRPARLTGYFLEGGGRDAYRSIAYAAEPALALLDVLHDEGTRARQASDLVHEIEDALRRYFDDYLLVDMGTNPFQLCPYGVYINPPHPELQSYRDAGLGRGVRNFLHPFNEQQIAHGTFSVVAQQAHAFAKASRYFGVTRYREAAEKLLQWGFGHNPASMCHFAGIGQRCPTPYSSHHYSIPESVVVGFNGFPDDRPHIEESTALDWTTQEVWTVPYYHAVQAICYLR